MTSESACPIKHAQLDNSSISASTSGCPIKHDSKPDTERNNIPDVGSKPVEGQKIHLDIDRQISSISKDSRDRWVYPSEQQFYNALHRKGKQTDEKDIKMMVEIHNEMNERCWDEIKKWESLHDNRNPELIRFQGQPSKISPKAWFFSSLGLAPKPFDRHDWIVKRNDKQIRYIIDYYNGGAAAPGIPVFYCDVRPALDGPSSLYDRTVMAMKSWMNAD